MFIRKTEYTDEKMKEDCYTIVSHFYIKADYTEWINVAYGMQQYLSFLDLNMRPQKCVLGIAWSELFN